MSGHSKWSQIKRQKGVADARRGQLFTKLGREIAVAARQGGSDPEANFRLRLVIQKARDQNMPLDNIERAIKHGSGEEEGVALAEVTYEGFGPGGAALLIQAVTDNRNRTVAEIRSILTRSGGNLGENGSVAWVFEPTGIIAISANANPEEMALEAIDAGAEDVKVEDGVIEVYTSPESLESVRKALEERKFSIESAELSMIPKTVVPLDAQVAMQTLKLLDKLEELDEVQRVFSNADFPDEIVESYHRGG